MEKRVYGLETEYGVVVFEEQPSYYTFNVLDAFLSLISRQIGPARGDSSTNFFHPNGSRIYRDMGHPEYATPECATVRDLIIWDKAGERIFEEAMAEINDNFRAANRPGDRIYLYKNNRDAEEATFGCHENYLVSRRTDWEYLQKCLIPFLVTRQIFCGSGSIEPDGFKISQRGRFITSKAENASTSGRPIIHLRDEALADSEKWRRLHLILGDANMSEISGFLKMGTTALVLRMVEDRFLNGESIVLFNPVASLKAVAADPACREELRLLRPRAPNGSLFLSAVEIQEIYLKRAKEYLAGFDSVEPEWREIVKRWEYVLDCLKDDPMKLSREVDWVAKKWLMESILERHNCGWDNFQGEIFSRENGEIFELLKTVDLQYHDIRRDFGLYNLMEKEGLMEKLVSEEEIALAQTEAPQNTRAKWRNSFFRLAADECLKSFNFHIGNWHKIIVSVPSELYEAGKVIPAANVGGQKIFLFYFNNDDPLNNHAWEADELLKKMKILAVQKD